MDTTARDCARDRQVAVGILLLTLALMLSSGFAGARAVAAADAPPTESGIGHFATLLRLPRDSRIEYVRLYFYDVTSAHSVATLSAYDAQGETTDLASAISGGEAGYGNALSPRIMEVVDSDTAAYALVWHPGVAGPASRLCAMSVAYSPSDGAGGYLAYHYKFIPGTVFLPRDNANGWSYGGEGCVYAEGMVQVVMLPAVMRN